MRAFADLYAALDETTKTSEKVAALVRYFKAAPAADAAWAVYFLIGRKPKQVVPTRKLVQWAIDIAGLPPWLFDESYDAVGDLAETIALVLPEPAQQDDTPLHAWIEERLLPLRELGEAEQRARLVEYWGSLRGTERFVFNKLITGA